MIFGSVWLKNGTYRGSNSFEEGPLVKLVRFYPNVLYATKNVVGFMKPGNL